jgi:hypothetical protein
MSELFPGYRFAGIENAERLGFGVEENAARLHRLAFVERRLMDMFAGHLLGTPEWEVKFLIGRHLHEDAEHHELLRTRITELRRSERSVDQMPDPDLGVLMEEAVHARDTVELLTGIYRVLKPALLAAYEDHLRQLNPLVDYPTARVLRTILAEEEEHIALGRQYLDTLLSEGNESARKLQAAAAWETHLEAFLRGASGIVGTETRNLPDELPSRRATGERWHMPLQSGRDARFTVAVPKDPCIAVPDRGEPVREGLEQMMWMRFHEMSAAEAVGAILYLEQGRPWQFYRDLARHCWDEVRHAAFGQAALQSEGIDITSNPNWIGWAQMALSMSPIEAYTHLTVAIEQAAMKYPPGKRQEYEFCRDQAKHALMTLYQDYDWADEVNHSQFGQRWIVKEEYGGDRRAAQAAGQETLERRAEYFSQYAVDGNIPDPYARAKRGGDNPGTGY